MNKKKGDTLLYIQEPKKEGEEGRENKKRGCCRCFLKAVSIFLVAKEAFYRRVSTEFLNNKNINPDK